MTDTNSIKKIKVAVGMSGGVDSSVAAALLKQHGYDVVGVFMRFWSDPTAPDDIKGVTNKCCSVESMMDARRVAAILDIPLVTINLSPRFKEFIVDNFLEEYEEGRTPNPCVRCNQFVKTGYFLEKARELGCEYIATGHYARVNKNENDTSDILIPTDLRKDQTYFLYRLPQDVVNHILFPLGEMTKDQTRELAEKFKLPVSKKQDSQEVCFVASQGHENFLKKWVKMAPGDIVDSNGNVLGKHDGLPLYTFGQRKGLLLNGGPWYVVKKDHANNRLIITNDPSYPGLFFNEIIITDVNWTNGEPLPETRYRFRLRHQHEPVFGTIKKLPNNDYSIQFEEGQRAVTPGQSAVLYEGERLVGGGVIS